MVSCGRFCFKVLFSYCVFFFSFSFLSYCVGAEKENCIYFLFSLLLVHIFFGIPFWQFNRFGYKKVVKVFVVVVFILFIFFIIHQDIAVVLCAGMEVVALCTF